MTHSIFTLFLIVLCAGAISCSCMNSDKAASSESDPFVGFFAHPYGGMLKLKRGDTEGSYRGSVWIDAGPFPVKLIRDGNIARGTVTYGGADHPFQVEHTPRGLMLSSDGEQLGVPFQRYANKKAYRKWFEAQGGHDGEYDAPMTPIEQTAE